MIVTNAGWDAVDAAAPARRMRSQGGFPVSGHNARRRTALKRTAKSCGPDASTPASSLRRFCEPDRAQTKPYPQTTVTIKPDHRESTKETVKTIACGNAG